MTKSKKTRGRKRQASKCSQKAASTPSKRTMRLLIPGLSLCVAVGAIYFAGTLKKGKNGQKNVELLTSTKEQPIHNSADSKPAVKDEFTQLKEEEMELARQVLKDFPNNSDSYMLTGDLHARHGDSAEAMKFWEKSLEIDPGNFEAWRNMGRIALETEQFDRAVKFLKKALEIRPKTPDLRSDIARALMDSGNFDEAITELKQEVKFFPSSFTAHFQLAESYRQLKEYDKAIEHYEQTIRLKPEHGHAHYGLAMVYTRIGRREKAQEHLSAFRKFRNKVDTMYSMRQVGSREYLVSLRESVVKAYLDAENIYRGSGNIAKAEEFLSRASELEPDNTRCLERLGSLYYATHRAAKALGCFEKIIRIDPNNLASYLNIGRIATRLKMLEKAEQAFSKTIALAPNNPVGYSELARFYLRSNTNTEAAYGLAQKAVTLEKSPEAYFLLGWAADVNGDRAAALQAMEQAIKLEPDNQQYRKIYERIRARN